MVTLADQLSGEFLNFFWLTPSKIVQSQRFDNFFCPVFFFNQSLDKKKSRESTKNNGLVNVFWANQKNDKFTGELVDQETDYNHMDVPCVAYQKWLRQKSNAPNVKVNFYV